MADATTSTAVDGRGRPDVGGVLRRLRQQRRMSLREVAVASGLSASFLASVERGESDIAVGRLARVAAVFDHDVASLLGYTVQREGPRVLRDDEQVRVTRGAGVELVAFRIPGTSAQLMVAALAAQASFDAAVSHAGIDVLYVVEGGVVVSFDGADHPVAEGQCVVWPASHAHALRNDGERAARVVGFTSESVY